MAAYTVFLDQVFIGNLVINYAILWAAAKLARIPIIKWRIAVGAVLGAFYSLALFLPANSFLFAFWFKIVASLIIAAAAFAPLNIKNLFICLGCFYLTSFVLGGLTLGLIFFTHSGRVIDYRGISAVVAEHFWPGIFLGLAALWGTGKGVAGLIKKGSFDRLYRMNITIRYNDSEVNVMALLDTGNSLKDPLTGRPIIIAEYTALKPLLPEELLLCLEKDGKPDVWEFLGSLTGHHNVTRYSAVPFQSLGNINGLMIGFRPDAVFIDRAGQPVEIEKVVIAICKEQLDPAGGYKALLGAALLAELS